MASLEPVIKSLGVCYYPEHWPEEMWKRDAVRMAELGITFVRIGEFSWSRLEPSRGDFQFEWLQRAIEILAGRDLKIVLGTPTATPPKWLVDEMPDMLAVDKNGATRKFGSRRHYTFSHQGYRRECARIVKELAMRFGEHDVVAAWQTDNEYDCHDTTLSFSPVDLEAFRLWIANKYQSPDALNRAWGNVFWSMEINDFDDIELPNLTVTEANPAHWMDYRRFASDQVVQFNRVQTDIIRKYSPSRDIIHNFMGRTLAFDHFDLARDLDISSWDSYPLGFLEDRSDRDEAFKKDFSRSGDPDFQAFHHDLYRATSGGRWWVMEQQPGPVNWAPHNPVPQDGMVKLWALEAMAHGAEVVSYFRWRQAPFAQEQMHSGLLRSDDEKAEGFHEAKAALEAIREIDWPNISPAKIAIVFDYPSAWAWDIQPQGKEFNYFRLVYDFYKGLRGLGQSVDFLEAKHADLSAYDAIIIPGLFCMPDALCKQIENFNGPVLIGPRTGSKTEHFSIPEGLPPSLPPTLLNMKIARVESLRVDCPVPSGDGAFQFWREHAEINAPASTDLSAADGYPGIVRQGRISYVCGWPNEDLMKQCLTELCHEAGLQTYALPDPVRVRIMGDVNFIMNYGSEDFDTSKLGLGRLIFGEEILPPSGFSAFRRTDD